MSLLVHCTAVHILGSFSSDYGEEVTAGKMLRIIFLLVSSHSQHFGFFGAWQIQMLAFLSIVFKGKVGFQY